MEAMSEVCKEIAEGVRSYDCREKKLDSESFVEYVNTVQRLNECIEDMIKYKMSFYDWFIGELKKCWNKDTNFTFQHHGRVLIIFTEEEVSSTMLEKLSEIGIPFYLKGDACGGTNLVVNLWED